MLRYYLQTKKKKLASGSFTQEMKNVEHLSWLQLWIHSSHLSGVQVLNTNIKSVNLEEASLNINSQIASTYVDNVEKKHPAKFF